MSRPAQLLACLALSLTACIAETDVPLPDTELDDEQVDVQSDALIRSPLSADPKWAVRVNGLSADSATGGGCSASVISEHWLLTAAHCLEESRYDNAMNVQHSPAPGTLVDLYRGPARYYVHPYWSTANNGVSEWDVALIELTHAPIDTTKTGRARFLTDARKPWTNSYGFYLAGYGPGTDPGGSWDCDGLPMGALRVAGGGGISTSSGMIVSSHPFTCRGDSGGPWFANHGGERMLFGVTSGAWPTSIFWPYQNLATDVVRHWWWIEATMDEHPMFESSCPKTVVNGYEQRRCEEVPEGPRQLIGLSGRCLQTTTSTPQHGSDVELGPCVANSPRQMFWPMADGRFVSTSGGYCLDVKGGSAENGTRLWTYQCNGTPAQRFLFTDGLSIMSTVGPKKCVEVKGGQAYDGAPIQIFDCNDSASQWWAIDVIEPPMCNPLYCGIATF